MSVRSIVPGVRHPGPGGGAPAGAADGDRPLRASRTRLARPRRVWRSLWRRCGVWVSWAARGGSRPSSCSTRRRQGHALETVLGAYRLDELGQLLGQASSGAGPSTTSLSSTWRSGIPVRSLHRAPRTRASGAPPRPSCGSSRPSRSRRSSGSRWWSQLSPRRRAFRRIQERNLFYLDAVLPDRARRLGGSGGAAATGCDRGRRARRRSLAGRYPVRGVPERECGDGNASACSPCFASSSSSGSLRHSSRWQSSSRRLPPGSSSCSSRTAGSGGSGARARVPRRHELSDRGADEPGLAGFARRRRRPERAGLDRPRSARAPRSLRSGATPDSELRHALGQRVLQPQCRPRLQPEGLPDGLPQQTVSLDSTSGDPHDAAGAVLRMPYVLTDRTLGIAGGAVARDNGTGWSSTASEARSGWRPSRQGSTPTRGPGRWPTSRSTTAAEGR